MNLFLSVYTPTYQRPTLLARCIESVGMQTCPTQHVIVPDHVGIGIGGMFGAIQEHAAECDGDYVLVLSDDNVLNDRDFAEDLRREVEFAEWPEAVIFKGDIVGVIQPLFWGGEPVESKIDLSCFATRRDVWLKHAGCWGRRYAGDFDFIHHLWAQPGYRLHWWDRLAFRALQIGWGRPEAVA